MESILTDKHFCYVGKKERVFLIAFDKEIQALGYERMEIGDFDRWGGYTVAYVKPNVKAKTYLSKIYYDGTTVSLRLYFRNIERHVKYFEDAPNHIKEAFINDEGKCQHCQDNGCIKQNGSCRHRKTYIVDGITYEKCDGKVFYFYNFDIENLNDYISIIKRFYHIKK